MAHKEKASQTIGILFKINVLIELMWVSNVLATVFSVNFHRKCKIEKLKSTTETCFNAFDKTLVTRDSVQSLDSECCCFFR